ncbi:MAG: helix-turn-helix transcriptional regulator [candidate division KSB1 bacterium]|nr:helix-turn-helix transcriptional regulator [candidate division KSB1 bacterium]
MMPETAQGLDIQRFAERLRRARLRADLTQTELAKRAGLHLGNLNELECGKGRGVRGDTVVRLCRALGCSADYLLGLTGEAGDDAA